MSNFTTNDSSGIRFQVNYSAPTSLKTYQSIFLPRLGHTNNLTSLFEGDVTESSDYVVGLIFVGCIILAVFLTWATLLMIFMCVGNKVGFLSGAPFLRKPQDSFSKEDDHDEFKDESTNANEQNDIVIAGTARTQKAPVLGDDWKSKATISRIVFILSGILCIAFASLMVTHGITNLQSGINTAHDNSIKFNQLTGDATRVIREGLTGLRETAINIRSVIETELSPDRFCPANPELAESNFGQSLRLQADDVLRLLGEVENFHDSELGELDNALQELFDRTEEINNEVEDINLYDWESLIILLPYTVFPALLIIAAMLALFDVSSDHYHCFISWFVLPIFIIMTSLAFIFAAIMAVMAGVNSDFCLPGGRDDSSPDEHIRSILRIEGYGEETFPFRVANWYISQCKDIADPLQETRRYGPELESNHAALASLITTLRTSQQIDELSIYCNRDYDTLDVVLESMQNVVEILIQSLQRVLDLAQCGRIIPLYTGTLYNAGCSFSPKAVFWVFSSCLIFAVFGMVMVTLRSSMKSSVIDQSYSVQLPPTESPPFCHTVDQKVIEEFNHNQEQDEINSSEESAIVDSTDNKTSNEDKIDKGKDM